MNGEGEKFGRWIGMSLALHLGLFALTLIWPSLLTVRGDAKWGSNTGGTDGIQVRITGSLRGIPLPTPPVVNETAPANDSKGLYKEEPKPEPAPKPKPEEKKPDETDAIPVPDKTKPVRPEPKVPQPAKAPPAPATPP